MQMAEAAKQFTAQYQYPRIAPGRFRQPRPLVVSLAHELSLIPQIAMWEKKWIASYSMIGEIQLGFVASSMAERIVDGVAPQNVFDDVMDLFANRKATLQIIMAVAGISIPQAIPITDGVKLVPPSELPATRAREDMFDLDRDGAPIHRGGMAKERRPGAVLVIDEMATVIYEGDHDWAERKNITEDVILKQDRALTCLTLSGPTCAPFVAYSASWINHPAYSYSGWGGSGYGTFHGTPPHQDGPVDPARVQAIYAQILDLKPADWPAIFRATDRLRRSRSHQSEVNRAIDLGIAVEMALLHEMGSDRGELRYRTALRGAYLLGKDGGNRREIFNTLRSAYDARSSAVHAGVLTKKGLIESLPVADTYCADAIRSIIDRRGFPTDWESIVLNNQPIENVSDIGVRPQSP
jgi:hypothetical protein